MLSTTTAIIHWDEPEEPNGQVVGYRVYYTSNNMLPVNQVWPQLVHFVYFIVDLITSDSELVFIWAYRVGLLGFIRWLCVYVAQWEKQMVRSVNFITIQGLTPNKTYYIRVLAFTSVGDGPLSQDLQIIAKTGGKKHQVREEGEDLR